MKYLLASLLAISSLTSFAHVKQLGAKSWQGSCVDSIRSHYMAKANELTWTITSFSDKNCSKVDKIRQNVFICSTLSNESECLMIKAFEGTDPTKLVEVTLEADDLLEQIHTIKITPQSKDKLLMNIRDTEESNYQETLTVL